MSEERHLPRWWMGGVAASGAACFTQCLDTVKVINVDDAQMMLAPISFLFLSNVINAAQGRHTGGVREEGET
uniref:Uncharacterized protein n=2 Tax=Timema TaxID=61471 RepID=A0A7R9B3F6_TIMSH|nr:unnamed protein product [Timema shepardi]